MKTTAAIYEFDFTDQHNPVVRIVRNPAFRGGVIKLSAAPAYKAVSNDA